MMRKIFGVLAFGLMATTPALIVPARAQLQPLTPQELTQQNDATIQKSSGALNQALTQQQIGQIQQQQREQELMRAGDPQHRLPTDPPTLPPPPDQPPAK
jgi:hypothetical protein